MATSKQAKRRAAPRYTTNARAELDLWLVLHERQRQLARVPETTRPKAFYIHPWRDFPKHIALGPAGLTPVVTDDHSEGWRLLFGEYLGITCEGALPERLEPVRQHFATGGW